MKKIKPRILWCGEFSKLKTGYAIYAQEVLSRLYHTDKFEIFEHAAYVHQADPRAKKSDWIVYCNMPDPKDEQQQQIYHSNLANQFGMWRFEEICVDCFPHVVCDIRDFWMCSHEFHSPLRSYYNHCIMPTVDALPQNEEWIDSYKTADGVFTYQDWSKEVLNTEGAGKIRTIDAAPPAADEDFQPMNGFEIKKSIGLEKYTILGTVMRNQKRKLFADLFKAFRDFLNVSKRNDILLYCHTSYPDMGWDLPRLLLQYGVSSKVLLTYICRKCGNAHPSLFSGAVMHCPKCQAFAAGISNVQFGVDNKVLAAIYNMFDVYIQWSNCLLPGQKIKTNTGLQNIEDIQIGDYVLTHTGAYQKVTNTFQHQNNNSVYEINVHGDRETLKLTAEHPVYVVDREKVLINNKTQSLREVLGSHIKQNVNYEIPYKFIEAHSLQKDDILVEAIDQKEMVVSKIKNGKFDCQRSNTKSLNYQKYYLRSINNIQPIEYSGRVYNIEVEKDNSYTTTLTSLHNSEGFGIPIIEAAACGVPIIANDYSAMSDIVRKLQGFPIKPLTLTVEMETGCYRAIPNNDDLIKFLIHLLSIDNESYQQLRQRTRKLYLENYGWNKTALKWENYIDSIDIDHYEKKWYAQPQYINIPNEYPKNLSNSDFARWLILNVLNDTKYFNSYLESKIIRDLNYNVCNLFPGGTLHDENSALFGKPNWKPFNQDDAFKNFVNLAKRKNYWENQRWQKIQGQK